MAKRKQDCSVNDLIIGYLKKTKCEKTLKLFEKSNENGNLDICEKFMSYLKKKESEKENENDDLGFEINFGVSQQVTKLPSNEIRKPFTNKTNPSIKKENESRKTNVPKDFIKKIKRLGMNVEDAEILFKSKIDWAAIYSENKVYCVEMGCDYFTQIDNEELSNHMITVHKYGEYPCKDKHCDYVAVSEKHLNLHGRMHTKRYDNHFWLKCLMPNCKATFRCELESDRHMRVHRNDLHKCQYCPYKYVYEKNYHTHLNRHFRINDHKCDQCGKDFPTSSELKKHYQIHEGIIYYCKLCNDQAAGCFQATHRDTITAHLRRKHRDVVGKNVNWESAFEKFIVQK